VLCAIAGVAPNSKATAIAAQLLVRNTWLLFMFFPPDGKKAPKSGVPKGFNLTDCPLADTRDGAMRAGLRGPVTQK
jgi:hypothetical protein